MNKAQVRQKISLKMQIARERAAQIIELERTAMKAFRIVTAFHDALYKITAEGFYDHGDLKSSVRHYKEILDELEDAENTDMDYYEEDLDEKIDRPEEENYQIEQFNAFVKAFRKGIQKIEAIELTPFEE